MGTSSAPGKIVRRARLSDAPTIAALHVAVSRETYADLLPPEALNAFCAERRATQWRQTIESSNAAENAVVFVACNTNNEIVGSGCCSRQRSQTLMAKGFGGEFQAIYVLHGAQRHGLGRALMAEMALYLICLSISAASCWVLRDNERARQFYEALDGEVIAEQLLESQRPTVRGELAYGWPRLDSPLYK
jgi:ribosomal protein S18 acetylase RimI-like enzyme